MKPFKTALTFAAAATLLTACSESSDKTGVDTKATVQAPAVPAAEASSGPSAFTALQASETGGAIGLRCSIDMIDAQKSRGQTITVTAGNDVRFRGWVSDMAKKSVPGQFKVVLSGPVNYGAEATAGARRPDVARIFKAEALANSGFSAVTTTDSVEAGEYEVGIVADADGKPVRCATNTRLAVVNPAG